MISLPFECHITVEPVFDERLELFDNLCKPFQFKAAKLFMQKSRQETPERSNKDTFATGHTKTYEEALEKIMNLKNILIQHGYKVWRCKIEQIILDERYQ